MIRSAIAMRLVEAPEAVEDDAELVAAEAGDGVARAAGRR